MPNAPLRRHATAPLLPTLPPVGRALSRHVLAVLASLVLVVAGLAVTGFVAPTAATAATAATAGKASMLGQVNSARARKDLRGYRWNPHLAAVAREQARRMARQSRLHHNPRLAADVRNFRRVGENVGYGRSSRAVHRDFMNSPSHRANILGGYTQIGIGQVRDAHGRLWVAQVFRRPSG